MLRNKPVRRAVVALTLAGAPGVAWAAPVSWTGLGDGATWGDPANWSGNAVPGPADDVTVSVAAAPAIVVNANVAVRSLVNAETIQINTGVAFAVATTASSSAPITLSGATVSGGAWTFTGGGAFQTAASTASTLTGATVAGEVLLGTASSRVRMLAGSSASVVRLRGATASVAFEPGATIAGQIIADGASGTCYVEMTAIGTLTLAPGAAIGIAPGAGMDLSVLQAFWFGSGHLDLRGTVFNAGGAACALRVRPRTLTVAATGRIENTGAGSTELGAAQAPNAWASAGTIAVSAGLMTLNDGWTNTGTLSVSGAGRLDLDGSFTSAGIGTISRSGGTIAVRGSWDNSGGYALNAATGTFLLQSGVVSGGSISISGGSVLEFTNADNQLNGVTYGGEVVLADTSDRVRLGVGTSVAGVRMQAANTAVGFASNSVINFPIIVEGSVNGTRYIESSTGAGVLTIGPSGSLTLAGTFATGTLSIGQGFFFGTSSTVTNNGAVTGLGSGGATARTVSFGGSSFVNNGTVSASGGANLDISPAASVTNAGTITADTGTLTLASAWSSTGTISMANGLLQLGGSFSSASAATVSRTGGTVDVTGVWNNTGGTFVMTAARGDWNLRGGTLQGGTMDFDGGRLVFPTAPGTLDGVAFLDEIVLEASSSRLRILGSTTAPGFRLRGSNSGIGFVSGYVLACPLVFDLAAGQTAHVEGTATGAAWTVGPAGSITTAPSNLGSPQIGVAFWFGRPAITNQGSIAMSTPGRLLTIGALPFTSTGSVAVTAGTIDISAAQGTISNLSLSGAGSTIEVAGTYTLDGALSINPGTTLSLDGVWSNAGAISLNAGTLNLGGAFTLATLGGFTNTGGSVNIVGALDNTGGTLALTASTGSWRLAGGSITGGQVTQTGGARLQIGNSSGNLLTDVSFPEELAITEGNGRVRLAGSTSAPTYRLSAAGVSIAFPPGAVMGTTILADGPPGSRFVEATTAGSLTIGPSGRVLCSAPAVSLNITAQWFATPALTNLGLIEKSGSGTIAVGNCATLDPVTHTLTGGVWRGLGSGVLSLGRDVWVNNATVELTGPGSLGDFGTLRENNGSFTLDDNRDAAMAAGAVGVQAFTNRGLLKLGSGSRLQLGNASEACSFTQTPAGTLEIELGGNDAITGFGSLRVFGSATLDGTVRTAYVPPFARACGQLFQFLDANSRDGTFATTDLPPVDDTTLFLLFYGGADARFSVSARADFNQDGFLDFFDYDDFVTCFETGVCPPGLSADFNGDDFVDFFDYDDFVFRFEAGCS